MQRTRHCRSNPTIKDNRRLGFYAAIFDEPTTVFDFRPGAKERSNYKEVVRAGAFSDTLKAGVEVRATVDHDEARTFATRSSGALLLQEDPIGLYGSCWLPETPLGDQVKADVESGVLDATSFRFLTTRDRWQGDECELLAVELADVCLTARPAYEATRGEIHLRARDRCRELFARLAFVKLKTRTIDTIRHHTGVK